MNALVAAEKVRFVLPDRTADCEAPLVFREGKLPRLPPRCRHERLILHIHVARSVKIIRAIPGDQRNDFDARELRRKAIGDCFELLKEFVAEAVDRHFAA